MHKTDNHVDGGVFATFVGPIRVLTPQRIAIAQLEFNLAQGVNASGLVDGTHAAVQGRWSASEGWRATDVLGLAPAKLNSQSEVQPAAAPIEASAVCSSAAQASTSAPASASGAAPVRPYTPAPAATPSVRSGFNFAAKTKGPDLTTIQAPAQRSFNPPKLTKPKAPSGPVNTSIASARPLGKARPAPEGSMVRPATPAGAVARPAVAAASVAPVATAVIPVATSARAKGGFGVGNMPAPADAPFMMNEAHDEPRGTLDDQAREAFLKKWEINQPDFSMDIPF